MIIHTVAASFLVGGACWHRPHASGCPSGVGGESQGLTFSFLPLLASSSLVGHGHPGGSPSPVHQQLIRASCSQSWGEGPASALISSFLAKSPTVSSWELNDRFGCLVVKAQRRNRSGRCQAPGCDLGRYPADAWGGPYCPVQWWRWRWWWWWWLLSALCRASLRGKGLRQKREGFYTLCRRAGAVAPLKLIGWLL